MTRRCLLLDLLRASLTLGAPTPSVPAFQETPEPHGARMQRFGQAAPEAKP